MDYFNTGAKQAYTGIRQITGGAELISYLTGVDKETAEYIYSIPSYFFGPNIVKGASGVAAKSFVRIGEEVSNQVSRVTNKSALNHALEMEKAAVSTAGGYINKAKIQEFGVVLKPTSETERKLIKSIMDSGDTTGAKTEKLINSLAKRSGYRLLKGGKYGGNKGFDHVLVGKDGSIVIVDSKPLSSKDTITLSTKGASLDNKGTTNQLSSDWIKAVENNLPDEDPVKVALQTAVRNKSEIKTIVTAVDKRTGEIKLIPVKVNNKVQ